MVFKELNISLPVFLFKYWRILFRMDKTVGFKKINLAFTLLTHAHTLHTYYTYTIHIPCAHTYTHIYTIYTYHTHKLHIYILHIHTLYTYTHTAYMHHIYTYYTHTAHTYTHYIHITHTLHT
jgi:hypothetical protein